METIYGTWEALRKNNRELCLAARKLICEKLKIEIPTPESMIGHLASIPVQYNAKAPVKFFNMITPLKQRLMDEYKIQVPVFYFDKNNPKLLFRISQKANNSMEQYEYFGERLGRI